MKNWNIVNPWKIPQHTANAKWNDWEFFSGNLMIVTSISSDNIDMDNEHPMESTHAAMSWNTSVYPFSIKFYNIEPELFVCFYVFFFAWLFLSMAFFCVIFICDTLSKNYNFTRKKKHAEKRTETHAYTQP